MSLNPLSLAKLRLRSPVFYCHTRHNDFACSATLTQKWLICQEAKDKLPALAWVLQKNGDARAIVFTNSIESTHNLKRILEICALFPVQEFHSNCVFLSQSFSRSFVFVRFVALFLLFLGDFRFVLMGNRQFLLWF
jgi:hypothetical protein